MNKRITSLFLSVVMLLTMLVSAVPAYAAAPALSVKADKTTANPGDTITYTIYLQQPDTITAFGMNIVVPTGLTFVADSGLLNSTAQSTFGAALEFTEVDESTNENLLQLQWFSLSGEDFTDTSKIELMTFKCKVNEDAAVNQQYTVTLDNVAMAAGSTQGFADISSSVAVNDEAVTVEPKPVAVNGVTIDETLSLKTGEKKTPSFNVLPADATNKAVTFTSNNTAVATVNATTGEVTGVKKGTATITITTVNGGFTDTCTVTVACSHANKTNVTESASDCKTQGWDAYVKCDDCGQLFDVSGQEIDAIPFRPLAGHTGGTASCTAKAVCTVCGNSYGELATHSFTDATQKEAALKSEGNCRDKAVYYYSCSACGKVEKNDNHTFEGALDEDKHVGGTEIINDNPADHKNQVDGYTGDTKCLGCGQIIAYGTTIPAGNHVASLTWTTDGTHHWKVCTVDGCGVTVVQKEAHTSTGDNVATCQKAAVCDICGVSYGEKADHVPATTWSKDASGHWYDCQTDGCDEKLSFAPHTPDHDGDATEEYAIKCTICEHVIQPMLNHEHKFDVENTSDNFKATDATCMKPATYYYACRCGEFDMTRTYEYGNVDLVNGHNWESTWSFDDDGHWYACQNGCDHMKDYDTHSYEAEFKSNTTTHWQECCCGHKINEGNHADTDKDGVCDTCDRQLVKPGPSHFAHWDYNGDGRCDYCGVQTNCIHVDANGDGKCDECSAVVKSESAKTFDAGITLYAGMALLSATGSAMMIGKKRKEND